MKLPKSLAATALSLCVVASGANAYESFDFDSPDDDYFGFNAAAMEFSADGVSDEADLTAAYARFGTMYSDYISVEIRLGVGVEDDEIENTAPPIVVDLNNFIGLYVRGGMTVAERFYPYAVLGYSRVKTHFDAPSINISSSDNETDVSYGLGLDFDASRSITLNIEYMQYLDKKGIEIEALSAGFVQRF